MVLEADGSGIESRAGGPIGASLRVCIVTENFIPSIGGSEKRAEKQARQLQALGHRVIVLASRRQKHWLPREDLDGLPVVRVGGIYRRGGTLRMGRLGIWPTSLGVLWQLWRRRHDYDLIHVVQLSSMAAMAVLVGRYAKKPVIVCIPSTGPSSEQRSQGDRQGMLMVDTLADPSLLQIDPAHWTETRQEPMFIPALGGSLLLRLVRGPDTVYQALSARSRSQLASYGLRPEQIVQISGGVDTEIFRCDPERRPDAAQSERVIVCVARYDYAKGVDVLLHAWARMMHAPAQWRVNLRPRLQLVGHGMLMSQLERLAEVLDIADSVEFLGPRTDVITLLQEAWGFVLPSRWEGMPNTLLEAMACGLPCIATRVSGSEDIISDGVDGLLIEPEQPAELAQALRTVIQDADLAQKLGNEGREKVVREYQLVHVVEQCVALYRHLLTQGGRAVHAQSRGTV